MTVTLGGANLVLPDRVAVRPPSPSRTEQIAEIVPGARPVRAGYVDHSVCNGCGTCWGKCPVKDVPSEFDQRLGLRKAVYSLFPQAVPNTRAIDSTQCLCL